MAMRGRACSGECRRIVSSTAPGIRPLSLRSRANWSSGALPRGLPKAVAFAVSSVFRVAQLEGHVVPPRLGRPNGAPDRAVMFPADEQRFIDGAWGTTLWVELKATGKEAKPHQLREHKRMRDMGQRVVVIDSLDGVDELLGAV